MSFLQTGFLIACAAVAIPVLVHLLSRFQVRRMELGTMRFLQEVIHDSAHRRKIRRWFLLMTRMALVALLALLFARPFLPERTRRDGDRLRLVLIDRSASMGMPGKSGRLIDDAVGAAADSASQLGADAKVLWAWFDRHVEAMPESTTRPSTPRAVVGDTSYLAALSWARDRVDAHPDALSDVVLVTDLQQTGLAGDPLGAQTLAFPRDVPVRIMDVGRPAANNLAITGVNAIATRLETNQDVKIMVTLFNFGTLPHEEVPLTASAFDGKRTVRLKKSINVPGGQAQEVSFDFGKMEPGTWRLTVALDVNDDLAADNRRLTAIQVAKPIDVLVLDAGSGDDGVGSTSYYLVTALQQSERQDRVSRQGLDDQPQNRGRFHADVIYLADEAPRVVDASVNPLVVVSDAGSLSAAEIEQLETYVRSGGRLLVFAGEASRGDEFDLWQQAGLAPGALQGPQRSGAMPFRIVSVSTGGAMLGPFEDPQHGDLNRLAFNTLLPVEVPDTTEVLAWFENKRPALTQHPVGQGRVVWFMSSADSSWGNWTNSPLYLPIVQQMAGDLLNLTGEGPVRFRSIGDDYNADRMLRNRDATVTRVAMQDGPSRSEELTFVRPGFETRGNALYVVNGLAKESDPTRLEPDAFAEHFQLTLADASNTLVSATIEGETQNELWPWFAAAVFVLLVAEFALANRTSA